MNIWEVLGIGVTSNEREIKRAYATQLKLNRPDVEPAGFRRLRDAYELALKYSAHSLNSTHSTSPPHSYIEEVVQPAGPNTESPPVRFTPTDSDEHNTARRLISEFETVFFRDGDASAAIKIREIFGRPELQNIEVKLEVEFLLVSFFGSHTGRLPGEVCEVAARELHWNQDTSHFAPAYRHVANKVAERACAFRYLVDLRALALSSNKGYISARLLLAPFNLWRHRMHALIRANSRYMLHFLGTFQQLSPEAVSLDIDPKTVAFWTKHAANPGVSAIHLLWSCVLSVEIQKISLHMISDPESAQTWGVALFAVSALISFSVILLPVIYAPRIALLRQALLNTIATKRTQRAYIYMLMLFPAAISASSSEPIAQIALFTCIVVVLLLWGFKRSASIVLNACVLGLVAYASSLVDAFRAFSIGMALSILFYWHFVIRVTNGVHPVAQLVDRIEQPLLRWLNAVRVNLQPLILFLLVLATLVNFGSQQPQTVPTTTQSSVTASATQSLMPPASTRITAATNPPAPQSNTSQSVLPYTLNFDTNRPRLNTLATDHSGDTGDAKPSPSNVQLYEKARKLYLRGDYTVAFDSLRQTVEPRDPNTLFLMARLYHDGLGTQKNYEYAREYFQRAALGLHAESIFELGDMYLHGESVSADESRAIEYYRAAAQLGSKRGQNRLRELTIEFAPDSQQFSAPKLIPTPQLFSNDRSTLTEQSQETEQHKTSSGRVKQ